MISSGVSDWLILELQLKCCLHNGVFLNEIPAPYRPVGFNGGNTESALAETAIRNKRSSSTDTPWGKPRARAKKHRLRPSLNVILLDMKLDHAHRLISTAVLLTLTACTVSAPQPVAYHHDSGYQNVIDANQSAAIDARVTSDAEANKELDMGGADLDLEGKDMLVDMQTNDADVMDQSINEMCNELDDDNDGLIDEGVLNDCGACGPVAEDICDGEDNDCDGATDEGVLNACGACGPVAEDICDGEDNDCDGATDEGVLNACGQCGQLPDEVCDGIDNDCDGIIDSGCDCRAMDTRVCGLDIGSCQHGVQSCVFGQWSPCVGDVGPSDERCNNADDDCDGQVDERLVTACGSSIGRC
ncbi:MAG: hypothetical protein CMH52_12370, partial [Myxococcales bacterium]|nr:hypothetical protein [Myxococcales bacterium]